MDLQVYESLSLLTILNTLVFPGVAAFMLDDATVPCDAEMPFNLSKIPGIETRRALYLIELHKPYLVSRVVFNVEACKAFDKSDLKNITLTFVDADDVTEQSRMYSDSLDGRIDTNLTMAIYDFPNLLYTKQMVVVASDALNCANLRIGGCQPAEICNNRVCKNGGTCITSNRCSCPKGFVGKFCGTKVDEVVIEGLEPAALVNNTLIAKNGQRYDVAGEVALVSRLPKGTSSSIGSSAYIMFAGGNVTSVETNQISRKRTFGLLLGLAHVFSNFVQNGFTHSCTLNFGPNHDHNHNIHLYNTCSNQRPGATLSYCNNGLTSTVNTGSSTFNIKVPWHPQHSGPHVITSSYSPSLGLSLHVNGQLLGSSACGTPHVTSSTQQPDPLRLCFGNCGNQQQNCLGNYFLSGINAAASCAANLVINGISHLFGLPQAKVTAPPTTTMLSTTTTPTTLKPSYFTAIHNGSNTTNNSTSKLLCYSCTGMTTEGACFTPTLCKSSEVCTIFKDPVGYNHRCLDANTCKAAKAAFGKGCWKCCSSSLCNFKCTSSEPCNDSAKCSLFKSAGYSVCKDPNMAKQDCKATCGLCKV